MYGRFGADAWAPTDYSNPATYQQPTSDSTVDAGGSQIPYYLASNDLQGQVSTPVSTGSQQVSEGSAQQDSGPSARDWFSMGQQTLTGFLNIFGQPARPVGYPPMQPQQPQGMPLWGWVAIGVGGVVLLGVAARALKKRPAVAGYRRRRARR